MWSEGRRNRSLLGGVKRGARGRGGEETGGAAGGVWVGETVETSRPKCHGWGEKEGHWTMAIDKLCVKCDGFGRVAVTRKVKVSLRKGIADGETVTVFGAGHAGYRRIENPSRIHIRRCRTSTLWRTVGVNAHRTKHQVRSK